jgi:hypothetical protein
MSDRVFEDARSIDVLGFGNHLEVYVFDPKTSNRDSREVMITVCEDAGYDSQRASFTMTAEEATAIKLFLIKQGY